MDRNRLAKEPRIYNRLIRRVQIWIDAGLRYANALFDTGANIFMLDSKIANKLHIRQIKRLELLEILGFSGTAVPSAGQAYAPFVRLVIVTEVYWNGWRGARGRVIVGDAGNAAY